MCHGECLLPRPSQDVPLFYFLGLRPPAGYASLKLYHVMSCFLYEKRGQVMHVAHPTPDDAGDASFLGPSRAPTQKADMGSRARASTVNSSVLWLGLRACARQKDRTTAHRSAQQFLTVFTAFCRARIAGMPGSAWRQNARK